MRKPAVVVLLITALLLPTVLANVSSDFMNSFIEAVNTGNYSLIEPYMSSELKAQFTEGYFEQIREFTLKNYGKLIGYTYVKNETSGGFLRVEYRVEAEKGSFPVLLAYKNGQLVGIALGIRARPNPTGMLLTMLGALIVLALFWPFKRPEVADLILGAGIALVLAIIIPFYSITSLFLLTSLQARAFMVAFLSALTIEGLKFYFSRNRNGLSIGLGIGIGQYVLLSVGTFVATNFIMKLPVSFSGGASYAFLEALLFTTFHGLSGQSYSVKGFRVYPLFAALELAVLYLMGVGSYGLAIGVLVLSAGVAWTGGGSVGISRRKAR
ncbi:DUF3887 domain-containing protein [Thermococcus sp.]|uniref:DUF3887 domain-containing protein n=1 Tax=Thermococcus sp. TaxID=35749 RepID=UPI0026292D83|nr:DUF3887 domain-containing protein [Thermococcus sp.]